MEFLTSESTRQQIDALYNKPVHAVGLFGLAGSGKGFVAKCISSKLLTSSSPTAAQLYIVRPNDKNVITIEQARGVISFVKLKSHHRSTISRVVIIEDAHKMTIEAQNALLKVIEEPPTDTVLVLTAENPSSLLPTITSRLTAITIHPISKDEVQNEYPNVSDAQFNKAWLISNGRLGLLHAILTDDDNELLSHIVVAKEILQANTTDRLIRIDDIQKTGMTELLEALLIVAKAGRDQAALKQIPSQIRKWQAVIKHVLSAQNSLAHNPNQKLLLTNLMLEL